MSAVKINGKVCPRHPEREGERYALNRACVGCSAEWRTRQVSKPKTRAQVLAERDNLLKAAEFFKGLIEGLSERERAAVGLYSIHGWEEHSAAIAKARGDA